MVSTRALMIRLHVVVPVSRLVSWNDFLAGLAPGKLTGWRVASLKLVSTGWNLFVVLHGSVWVLDFGWC